MTPIVSGNQLIYNEPHLVAMAFLKTSSPSYDLVVEMCRSGQFYEMRSNLNLVIFGKTLRQAQLAIAVLDSAEDWKSLKVFTEGKLQWNGFNVKTMLECYVDSINCNDHKAHCFEIVRSPYLSPMNLGMFKVGDDPAQTFKSWDEIQAKYNKDRFQFPCKKLLKHSFKFDTAHPSSLKDQIQAFAVKVGCNSCPHFSAENFKKVEPIYWE